MDQTKTARSIAMSSPSVIRSVQPKGKTSSPSDEIQRATGTFDNLINAIAACIKHKSTYCDFEHTQDQLSSMTLQLTQAIADKDTMENLYKSASEDHERRLLAWKKKEDVLKQVNKDLTEQLAKERQQREDVQITNVKLTSDKKEMERSIKSLRTDLMQETEKALNLEKALHAKEEAVVALTTDKEENDRRLSLYESYIGGLDDIDVDDFSENINTLWTHCQSFVEKYFLVDVSTDLFIQAQWDSIIEKLQLNRDVPPLPLRNSAAAKRARMAAALAVIASYLSTRIFTPVYIPAANEGIRELLRACAEVDCKREAMCRALMLSAYQDDERSQAADVTLQDVYNTVKEILEPLIDRTKLSVFRTELQDLFGEAVVLWRRAQYSTIKFDATVEVSYEALNWKTFLDDSNSEQESAGSPTHAAFPPARTFVTLVLFPCIIVVREERDELVFPGIVLRDWQAAEAAQQLREDMEARRVARGSPRRERKATMNGNVSAPTSPTKAKHSPFLGERAPGRVLGGD